MKLIQRTFLLILLALVVVSQSYQGYAARVRGYYRKNGTYVAPYERSSSSSKSSRSSSYSSSSYSGYSATPVSGGYYSQPRSYNVYQQRQTQGPRAFSKGMKRQKYHEQGGNCSHCGVHGSMSYMEADHVIPYSKGGKTEYSNLQILCRPCNRSKSNRSFR